ncbi:MAG: AMP-binding protein, partial [Prevotellaceae bacterium]|nr:AMP-binding protein [Candidatus Faecinaster equi]
RIKNDDMAIILFTSGTTGVAKGVMLSHRNITSSLIWVNLYIKSDEHDTYFSILPMHHVYESSCTMIQTMFKGASVAYNRGLKYILKDIQLAKPTVMMAVPLIYEKFYNNIQKALIKEGKAKSLGFIMKLNKVTTKIGLNISRKAAGKIVEQFGNNIRIFIAGGAKSDPKILQFFRDLGIMAVQGYGLTETSPLIALNPVDNKHIKNDSAGRLILGTEMMIIDPDENGCGELCFKGPQVMLGYYNNDEATEDCMRNGWFHSGDIGYVDKNNYIYITGRKKTVIIAGNGKNVYPDELEKKLQRSPYIEECMVWADESGEETGHRGIYATIRVDEEAIKAELGDRAGNDEAVYAIIDREVDKVNANMPDWKSVKHIRIRKREFNKTTAMKIKRFVEDNKLGN